jgi:hypothetical protein
LAVTTPKVFFCIRLVRLMRAYGAKPVTKPQTTGMAPRAATSGRVS